MTADNPTADSPPAELVYVWELPVRLAHWTIVLSIVVLTVTGLYIHAPFVAPPPGEVTPSVMGTVRFIHELTAIAFTIAVSVRVYWAFVGNRYANWRAFVPHTRAQWRSVREMFAFYTFRRPSPPPSIGHNSLAGLAYLVVYLVFFGQILTGLLLFAFLLGTGPVSLLFGWTSLVPGGIQSVRLLHYLLTFVFLAFTIHHVYSSVLIDLEERNGLVSSIVTGFKTRLAEWRDLEDGAPDA
ncbi:MAG: Ni/Fe-hydrogenase, b-type cytochrome subunit [Gemmatimonadales bacterium]|nr:MAG: Ni/Fe-hydrogenase, b-type cytochrome subunit [Gemmatimonadales bacterium]